MKKFSLFFILEIYIFLCLSVNNYLCAYIFNCSQGCTAICGEDTACLWRCFACCPPEEVKRKTDCLLCGGIWQVSRCLSSEAGEGEEIKDPPTHKEIGLVEPFTAPVRPVTENNRDLVAQFYYSAPVDIIVGYLSPDFQEIKWLDPRSCTFKETFSWLSQQTELLCPLISLQEARGYLFWLVSPVPLLELDFEQGVYELKFYMLGH